MTSTPAPTGAPYRAGRAPARGAGVRRPLSGRLMDNPAFPTLTPDQLGRVRAAGRERATRPGDLLFKEGDDAYDFFVVLNGAVLVYEDPECGRPIAEPIRAGQFLGEVGLLLGEAVYATARVEEAGAVLQVPADRFRQLVGADTDLAETVLAAFTARRGIVSDSASGLQLVGSRTDPDAVRIAEFSRRNYLPFRWLDLEGDADQAAEVLREHGRTVGSVDESGPVVLWGSKTVLDNPSLLEIARAVGIGREPDPDAVADLLIVGAGPAGLAAAVYGASEGLDTVLLDEVGAGGQASWSSRIENYLGFPSGLSGTELATRATLQARKFGARFVTPHRAVALRRDGAGYAVELAEGPSVRGRAVVLATGAHYRRLPVPDLRLYEGAGVYYAATEMEARGCADATAVVVGGGNSAGQAAMFLSERSARVLLLVRGDGLEASMSSYLSERVLGSDQIEVRYHAEVRGLEGDGPEGHRALAAVTVEDTGTSQTETVETPALFVFIGAEPCTAWLRPGQPGGALGVATDRHGFIRTGSDVADLDADVWPDGQRPTTFETSLPGVFAVGDVRAGSTKRVAGAVGEGAVTVKAVHGRLATVDTPQD